MSKNCPECGSSRVVEDDLYSQKQWVCEDCGSVVSEGLLTTTLSEESHSRAVPFFTSTAAFKKPCRNLVSGFSRLRALCRIFRLSSSMEDASANLFERAYNHPNFLLNPLARMKYSLMKFCKIAKAPEQLWCKSKDTINKRLNELLEVLCKLGRELPWVRPTDIQMNTVTTLVEDILKHRKALLILAVKHYEKQLEETQTSQYSESELSDSKSTVQTQCKSPPDEEDEGCELPPDHWGKRHLFLPPCVRSQKRQKINEAPLEVTGDEDISDSEIESYIRSEEEIKLFAKARKKI